MRIQIKDLEVNLKTRFQKEINHWYFEILDVFYCGFDGVSVTVGHYSDKNFYYKLDFNKVYSYRIIQESYYPGTFPDENFQGFSFFQMAESSRYKKDIFNNTSLGEMISTGHDTYKIYTYRLICQNNFIDILTIEEPLIELVGYSE